MHATAVKREWSGEVSILARVLGDAETLTPSMARYILECNFSSADKSRMHELAVRNQDDTLAASEKDELLAYAKAGTLLSTLKSRARRVLRDKAKRRTS